MSAICTFLSRRAGSIGAFAVVLAYLAAAAHAQPADSDNGPAGRIDFNAADLPAATVEVDLSQGMFSDLFGLGDAAIAGVSETLLKSAGAGDEGTRLAAEQLAAARQIMKLASEVVREVRVRVYEDLPEDSIQSDELMSKFDAQLRGGNWENIVRIRDGEENVRVSLLRSDGAVRGAFIIVAGDSDLVLANVVGDISPDNVKKLTSAAAQIGLENGLQPIIEMKMRELKVQRKLLAPPAATSGKSAK